ncbi:hypothetical protein TRFO_34269 [Tritrichomonas foetus]|uniref:Uncharacterized protein n=1 Tax=Tritrichomonas foetus TaxID=1144522 RepID=A0A1J4JQ18_9EUKA|nr:hypothetical protein TRFO_34269 [Tritrichomonas foetus]|eukprot:OHS99324.1 hypothetical protein TRFO_34269 [Tritrichomonas foetus]
MKNQMETDLRKWKCGGWEASKITVKVNGRWSYIYNTKSSNPTNVKEPIKYNGGYKPPNHQNESFEPIHKPKTHPLRDFSLSQRRQLPKLPIQYQNNRQKIVSRNVNSNMPFWVNQPEGINDIRAKTALDSRIRQRETARRQNLRQTLSKNERPLTSDFSRSHDESIQRDDNILMESQRLASTYRRSVPRVFYVC